jgi:hypothetical protein
MSPYEREVSAVAEAVRTSARCHLYLAGEPCDGLDGCDRCLTAAAKAVLRAVELASRRAS